MNRGKIIIVEGTSCVGKTTLCSNLQKLGWIVIPEAIRYLEKETQKKGDEASPIPDNQTEEEYYQTQLFRIELQKIREANHFSNRGFNVVIDKSAIAIIATAKAFEKSKGFVGTFSSACSKYFNMLKQLDEEELLECDGFLLLTANFDVIRKRNMTRNHILEGIWLEEETINSQKRVLKIFAENIIGKLSNNIVTETLDTTNISKQELLTYFFGFANSIVLSDNKRKGGYKK